MKHLDEYSQWVTDTSSGDDVEYDYISSRKIFYGIHEVLIHFGKTQLKVKAKFDTGARSSSIDLSIAKNLGMGQEIVDAYRELEKLDIPKDITPEEKKQMNKKYSEEYSKKYPGISSIQIVKSSSGFSIRPYVRLMIEFNGRFITTEANIRDRAGMKTEMLIGLKDMQ